MQNTQTEMSRTSIYVPVGVNNCHHGQLLTFGM